MCRLYMSPLSCYMIEFECNCVLVFDYLLLFFNMCIRLIWFNIIYTLYTSYIYIYIYIQFKDEKNNNKLKIQLFEQFCNKYDGCGYDNKYYKLDQLLSNNTNEDQDYDLFISKYHLLWNDFVLFGINFMDNDLYNSLVLNSVNNVNNVNNNVNIKDDWNYFRKYFKYQRNQFIYLPINGDQSDWGYSLFSNNDKYNTFNEYKEIVHYFSNNNNNNINNNDNNNIHPILKYFLIYNAIFTMMNKYYYNDKGAFNNYVIAQGEGGSKWVAITKRLLS